MYLQLFAANSYTFAGYDINSRIQSRESVGVWNDVSIANPVPSWEELIINIYSPLQSAWGEKFISTAGTAVITFFHYSGSERVERHRLLLVKVHVL
ncbi:hypothetical protein TNCV_2882071 [Trichonephila clavipes]|nr:hypothetical protein TNCV_2882071 [Trichonephila clavipes]